MTPRYFTGSERDLGNVAVHPAATFAAFCAAMAPVELTLARCEFAALPAKQRQTVKRVRYFVPAAFESSPSPRKTEHAQHCNLICLDVDDPVQARQVIETGAEALAQFGFLVYHTASSTPKTPRVRIVVSADRIPVSRYPAAVRTVAELLGLPGVTRESLVPVQPMFWPTTFASDGLDDEPSPIIASNPDGEAFGAGDIIEAEASSMAPVDEEVADSPPAGQEGIADLSYLQTPMDGVTLEDAEGMLAVEDPDCSMQQWIERAAALKHQFGDDAYAIWDAWSAKGKKYVDSDETAYRWKTLKAQTIDRRPVTIRSLIKSALSRGWVNTTLAKRGYADTVAWIRSETRSTEELLDHGVQRIAKISPLINILERKSLMAALKDKLGERGITVSVVDLRKQVKKLETESAKTTGLPPWSKGLCFVTSQNIFYRFATDRKFTPEVVDLMYTTPQVDEEERLRPRDYLIQVAGVPQVENLRYDPSRTGANSRFFTEGAVPFVNTYQPSYPKPDPEKAEAAGKIFWNHLCNLIAEPEYRLLVMDFLAYHVQHPGKKIRWAMLIQSTEGAGKTALAVALSAVCGRRNGRKLAGSDILESSFNDWSYGSQFVAIEEIRVIGHNRYAVMDKLKPLITDDEISLHRKKEHHVTVPNITNYLMFTNYHDALAINDSARRYFVISSPLQTPADIAKLGGPAYFEPLFAMIRDNAAGLRAWFEAWPIDFTRFQPEGRAPMTPYLKELAASSASPLAHAVSQAIEDEPHALVRRDLIALDCLRACLSTENIQPFTDQALASVVREAGFARAGRHTIGGARRQLWVRGIAPEQAKRVAEEREELF